MTEKERQKIIDLHLSGLPLINMAEELGYSVVTLKRRISEIRKTTNLPNRAKSTQKTRIDRAENDIDSTAWNVRLGNQYITRLWIA